MRQTLLSCGIGCLLASVVLPSCATLPETRLAGQSGQLERERETEELIEHAHALSVTGDYTRAEQYLNLALSNGGSERRILPLLVQACILDQRYRDAVQYLENELRRHPREQKTRFLLATLHQAIGSAELARKELEQVVAIEPNHAEAHYALAVLLRDDVANYAAADHHFREYLRSRPDGEHAEEARGSLLASVP